MMLRMGHFGQVGAAMVGGLVVGSAVDLGWAQEVSPPEARPEFRFDWDRRAFGHGLWDGVLRRRVNQAGLVDYEGLAGDAEFEEYLYRLAHTDPRGLASASARLAFWINAYNALTIRGVLETLPEDRSAWAGYRISEQRIGRKDFWDGLRFMVGGRPYSLNEIEHEILRKADGLRDPRIHVALVCAARGCPGLWNRAYEAEEVDRQLEAAMRRYVSDPRQCRFDREGRVVTLSKIFQWYGGDFTDAKFSPRAGSVPAFLSRYVEDAALAESLRKEKWRVRYLKDYDWKLNIQ